ncbi:MAG TPA: ABC transporter ATP-binding protein [Candidatus Saccharibacteria bacterium]|nr:ABC transporter ATP-binding protein [Candidatus Saccharibacteria bacterium]
MADKKQTLVVKNLTHTYGDGQRKVEVLKDISVEFEPGKLYAIVGESGSGKTTLISLISALDKIQSGEVQYGGQDIHKIGAQQFRQHYVNVVFQAFNLIKYMTARENVEVGLDFSNHTSDNKGGGRERAYELLESVGITRQQADSLVQKLSGGQQQRVAIARCLAGEVPIIVADEPTGNLDEETEAKILQIFKQIAASGKIVIVVTHSQKVASQADAVVYHMKSGKLSRK